MENNPAMFQTTKQMLGLVNPQSSDQLHGFGRLDYIGLYSPLPSGYVKIAIENNYDIYIVNLPIQNGDYLWLC
jgi:hypothetical protein